MMDELVKAKEQKNNAEQMSRHIENVQLLCDIILANDHSLESPAKSEAKTPTRADISEQEMKAMIIGQQTQSNKVQTQQIEQLRKGTAIYDEDESNGDSLFDF